MLHNAGSTDMVVLLTPCTDWYLLSTHTAAGPPPRSIVPVQAQGCCCPFEFTGIQQVVIEHCATKKVGLTNLQSVDYGIDIYPIGAEDGQHAHKDVVGHSLVRQKSLSLDVDIDHVIDCYPP